MTKGVLVLAAIIGVAAASYGGLPRGYANPGYGGSQGTWGDWGYWTACSKECGGGYKTRSRECQKSSWFSSSSADCPGSSTEKRSCNTQYCVLNGGWSEWGYYGECSAQCGAGTKSRYRTCTNPAPAHGGADCYGSDHESVDCNNGYCSVNGGWSEWGYYGECSETCGAGTKSRYRTCTNPAPSYGGADCYGYDHESVDCNNGYCSVNGGWSEWGYYGECSETCGAGTKSRYRTCTNPAPSYGGADCYGYDHESVDCNNGYCSVNGGWSEWGYYGECSETCGAGTKSRYRTCTNPAPSYGGADCYGYDHESVDCNNGYCSVNGGWSEWGYYGDCSAACGGGYKGRHRYCNNPTPAHGGADCYGYDYDNTTCNTQHCAVHGGWGEWGYYGDCSVECGSGVKTRHRYCNNPAPAYGGNQCYGSDESTEICTGYNCQVNGGWSEWGYYGECSAQCGAGTKSRYRTCTNPAPAHGGADCYGYDHESVDCNNGYCSVHGGWSEWGYYGDCSVECGSGVKTRHRYCNNPAPAHGGNQCYGSDESTEYCTGYNCQVNGGWSEWGYYGECSAQCGAGTKTRYRTCTNPAPSHGGSQCYGLASDDVACYGSNCAVDGGWTYWTNWSQCSGDCGTGRSYRSRSCTNPSPSYSGAQCSGLATEYKTCQSSSNCYYGQGSGSSGGSNSGY